MIKQGLSYGVGDRIRVDFAPGTIVTVRAIRIVDGGAWIDIEEIRIDGVSPELVTEIIRE